jgi:hypothetical protein
MTYTGSQATAGRGSTLSVGPTPTMVGEIKTSSVSGNSWGTADVTNFESGADQAFITTIRNNGELKLAGNRVSADAGQVLVEAAYQSGAIIPFTLQLPKSPSQATMGDKYTGNCLVQSRSFDVDVSKEISWDVTLKPHRIILRFAQLPLGR